MAQYTVEKYHNFQRILMLDNKYFSHSKDMVGLSIHIMIN